ncbi:hypothetical protein GJ496_007156 [Pomphorhynchus laevis]|nr:hypothetical protein GJ496_007156 [Pomphorhynchus laevis]
MTRLVCKPTYRSDISNLEKSEYKMADKPKEVMDLAQEYVNFLNDCKSPWHVCDRVKQYFVEAGFQELDFGSEWTLAPGGKYYVMKGGSTIAGFALGGNWKPNSRIGFIAPHSDSPALRIKPDSNRGNLNFIQVGCVLYGGGFWHTWFDRDLGLAGRVYVRNGNNIERKLISVWKAIANVPDLAIHFDGSMNSNFQFNFETQFLPMIGIGKHDEDPNSDHQPLLLKVLSEELNVSPDQILQFELNLFDTNPARIGGANNDFVFGQFQDNQHSTFGVLKALLEAVKQPDFMTASHAYMYITYDHEEVGNKSDVGASTNWTNQLFKKICGPENFASVINRSFALSTDVNHGVNPNYSEFYEINSRAMIDGDPSINYNYGLSMATNASNAAIVKQIAEIANVKLQTTIPMNGKRAGATHGPSLSAQLGITTCDLGPLLIAMHSIRETTSTMGLWKFTKFIEHFYRHIGNVMDTFENNTPVSVDVKELGNHKSKWSKRNKNNQLMQPISI